MPLVQWWRKLASLVRGGQDPAVEAALAQRLDAATRLYQTRRAEPLVPPARRARPSAADEQGCSGTTPVGEIAMPPSQPAPPLPPPTAGQPSVPAARAFQPKAHVSPLAFDGPQREMGSVRIDDADSHEATYTKSSELSLALLGVAVPENRQPSRAVAAFAALTRGADAPGGRPRATLTVCEGKLAGYVIALDGGRRRVGRGPDNDVQILDRQLSRQHFAVEYRRDGYTLEDVGSRNGTYVNGVRVYSAPLRNGDLVQVGTLKLEFRHLP